MGDSVDVFLALVPRKSGWSAHNLFVGSTKEADVFLDGMVAGVGLCPSAVVDADAQDGTDA